MTVSANIWQARAAMCELLALSFRYPEDKVDRLDGRRGPRCR